ncbi:hypothetical protein M2650_06695 [Luteimonas sp. SX5]|uniref:Secreted protein n=1 Tax=Luteimonas galliterrae TaxID=2940486 RepID=A0ABT0MHH0_9GAMM|nr:hypothetical protein [Luteimonas galliterrae]MCL1634321.1 hypothetical protein [Luteimonas galliterrae]
MLIVPSLLLACGVAQAQTANCSTASVPQALPVRPTLLAPISSEMSTTTSQLGAPSGVLAQAYDEAMSVDLVLLRLRVEGCNVANATPARALDPNDPSVYKPKTQFDNTPWRFDMNQNGKRMTADEFDAWMKARGVRIAGRKPAGAAPAAAPVAPDGATAPAATAPAATPSKP